MKYFRKFGRRRVYRKRGVSKRRVRGKVSKSVKSYVKRTIHRNLENKEITRSTVNESLLCVSSGTPNGIPLIPPIVQGVTEITRIGNMIKCTKGFIKGRVNLLPYNATTNPLSTPLLVKLYLLRHIGIQGQVSLSGLDWTNLFRTSTISPSGFTNSPLDMFAPINEDYWRLLGSKEFKIGAASATTTGQVGSGGYFDNSPMSVPFYFNFGKFCKKQLKYNDNSTPYYPTNENVYLACQVVQADGGAQTTYGAEWHYCITFKYEDA